MDQDRLEFLISSSLTAMPRRTVCRTLSGGLLGATLTRLGLQGVLAGCTKLKKKCNDSDECCGDLVCGRNSTQHQCTGSLPKKNCCIPLGGRCRYEECECCGNATCDNRRCKRN